ncbi:hypothetical protein MKEN_00836400 [Mycena kentingensis (nom. inval.)]|nr:hypothetical protein MKEN_00836400 [Mycena kentingensis (nom. inval.)]
MFFRASTAFTLVVSLTAVFSAPLQTRQGTGTDFVPQACSGPNFTGTCVDLGTTIGDGRGTCTPLPFAAKSLKLNVDNDCVTTTTIDCSPDFSDPNSVATEHFSNDADIKNLRVIATSVSCQTIPGLVNGLFPQ